jgi:hypothetical protein
MMNKFLFVMDYIYPIIPITALIIMAGLQLGWAAIIVPVLLSVAWIVYHHVYRSRLDIKEESLFWKMFGKLK